ncbi:MAG TPA: hypothetical protein VMJ32_16175 [Pirellulales bacterium]|nr:hypothetical protein [Pirellulales bacterium]
MFARLKRTTVSFLVVVGAYCVYRVAAVPWMEPQRVSKRVAAVSLEKRQAARESQNRLGGYARFFPEGSWELDNPIVLDSATAKYLVKEYQSTPDHRVLLNPCTVIYFLDGDAEAVDSHRRVIILQAPHGAELQFDDQEDLDSGKMGQLLSGVMHGPVTIQSGPTRPEGGDDFLVTTHDVQMKDNLIFTPNEVNFRFGASFGHGRDMRIELLPGPGGNGNHGTNFSGVQSFQLLTDVRMHLQPSSGGFLPGDRNAATSRTVDLSAPMSQSTVDLSAPAGHAATGPITPGRSTDGQANNSPVDIQCQGPFEFDLVENVATFHDRVDVVRPHPNGPSDQMNCELLNLYFAPRQPQPGQATSIAAAAGTSSSQTATPISAQSAGEQQQAPAGHAMPQLEPKRLVARGNPVVVRAESMGGEVRGERLDYDIVDRHLLMEASGNIVRIDSPQLSGEVSRLEAWMRDEVPGDNLSSSTVQSSLANRGSTPRNGSTNSSGNQNPNLPRPHYEIYGGILKVWSVNHASQNEVERVSVEGNVQFAQSSTQTDEKPLETRGDYLEVLRANTTQAEVAVTGRPAEISAQGLTMFGQTVHLHRGQNRLWIDGPGRMIVTNDPPPLNNQTLAATDQQGLLAANHGTTTIDWQRGMVFDGRTVKFDRDVVGQRIDHETTQTIRAPQLEAILHERVDFNAVSPQQQQRSQVEWVTCRGNVWLENRQTLQGKMAVLDQLQHLSTLTVNQITGDLTGQATDDQPGRLFSWRLGSAGSLGGGLGGLLGPSANVNPDAGSNPASSPNTSANSNAASNPLSGMGSSTTGNPSDGNSQQINFLDVQFERGISGNVLRRELVFQDHVRTVYGPVPAWDAKLDADSPAGLPPRSLVLTCDQLATNQSPPVQGRSMMEMQATGNTRVEGQQLEGDTFTALAQQLTYSEAKDMLVLLGDGRSDAQLLRQMKPGAPQTKTAAASIYYWPSTRQVKMGGLQYLDSTQFSTDPQPHTAHPMTPSAAQQPVSSPRR